MDRRMFGLLLGVAGVGLWFMPLAYVNVGMFSKMFEGMQLYQAGHHIGGIAYLLLLSSAVFAISSWILNKHISIVAATVLLGVSVLFLFQAGSSAAWGLICLLVVSLMCLVFAFKMKKAGNYQGA